MVLLIVAAIPLKGGSLELCLENPARVDADTLQAFRTELNRIMAASNRFAAHTACGPGVVTIVLRIDPPSEETSALGAIRVRGGRMVPEIELFVQPTAQIVGTRLAGVLGRALARVATHELGHWMSQSSAHADCGVMIAGLSGAHLRAADRGFFRLPRD